MADGRQLRRRALLGVPFSVGLVGGCSEGAAAPNGSGTHRATSARAAAPPLRTRAARDSATLLAQYDATMAAHPDLAARLRALRAEVARHQQVFADGSSAPAAPVSAPPADPGAALKALADAERRLADFRATALLDAPPELARLLASVAAAGAGHALLLTGGN